MGRHSLIAIGRQAFEILELMKKFSSSQIARILDCSIQVVSNTKKDLFEAGWIDKSGKTTKSGEYFIKKI